MQHSVSNTTETTNQEFLFPQGFLAIRSGLFEHLENGKMTPPMLVVFMVLLRQCNWATGVWNGNSYRIAAALSGKMEIRTIQYNLSKLSKAGYCKSFGKKGHKGNYFVLISKYRPLVGELKGKQLNAEKSTNWGHPVYEDCLELAQNANTSRNDVAMTLRRRCDGVAIYQEYKEFEESKEGKNINNNIIKNADDVADAGDSLSSNGNLSAKEQFLRALASEFSGEHTTPKQVDEAWKRAQAVGPETFWAALKVWQGEYESTDTFLGESEGKTKSKSWPLRCFLDSLHFSNCVTQAKDYLAKGVRPDELSVFLDAYTEELTPERVGRIRKCGEDWRGGRYWAIRALNACQSPDDYAEFDREPLGMAKAMKDGLSPADYRATERDRQKAKELNDACRARDNSGESLDDLMDRVSS